MSRDPFPYPRFENDTDFSFAKQVSFSSGVFPKCKQNQPWKRLYETKTLASERRAIYYNDPQAPRDSLDFVIKSVYDHHQEFLKSNAETLYQPETLNHSYCRVLNNQSEKKCVIQDKKCLVNYPIISMSDKKENIHCINGAIASHHCAATNRGYSRKNDGGFYGC